MIEIIPNWHPIFVHFTVALFTTSVVFYVFAYLTLHLKAFRSTLTQEFEIVARWCLWTAALITVATVTAGFYAYYTVAHDAISHAAMIIHRNWALPTAAAIFLLASWSIWCYVKHKGLTLLFVLVLLLVQGLLVVTAWYGAELVFRHGMGVMSTPQSKAPKHHH